MSERTIADRVAHWVEDMTPFLPAGMRLTVVVRDVEGGTALVQTEDDLSGVMWALYAQQQVVGGRGA